MKALIRDLLCAAYKYSGAMRLHEALARRPSLIALLFHRVTDAIPKDGLTVGTAQFRRLCGLLRRRFRVVPLAEVFRLARSGGPIPRRTVAITFDDCYRDNLAAARVLAEHGLPACFFIPTSFVGTDAVFPWDRDLPRMPNLSWDEIREMASLGHEIGSHTVTHPDMAQVPEDQARRELAESKETLEREIGRPVRWFAYPFGGPEHIRADRLHLVTEAGYEGCVSAYGDFVHPDPKALLLPRKDVQDFKSLLHFELYTAGCLRWFYDRRGTPGSQEGRSAGYGPSDQAEGEDHHARPRQRSDPDLQPGLLPLSGDRQRPGPDLPPPGGAGRR
jgi:peptidoglycan/xylan/chitin deacetylase (PgdA/CDA1 family)